MSEISDAELLLEYKDRVEMVKEITRLKKALEIANEAIGFYADPMTYFSDHEGGEFGYISEDDREDLHISIKEFNDTEPDFYDEVGGKLAREAQKQIKDVMEHEILNLETKDQRDKKD